jgi:hypothetical protein
MLEDGDSVQAKRVVIATGIASFAYRPYRFQALPPELASHSSAHSDFGRFAGQRVVVVGGGQSALESAALVHESGADVEVIVRAAKIHWLRYGTRVHNWLHSRANPFRRILYPPSDVGPPGLNWIVDTPDVIRRLPFAIHSRIAHRAIRPAGAGWLLPRMRKVKITTGHVITSASLNGRQVRIRLDDGAERCVDHVLLATGYRIDVSKFAFIAPELVRSLRLIDGYPQLTAGFEASVPGLHFLGATAARSFGPLMRFVAGTPYAARALTQCVLADAPKSVERNLVPHESQRWAQASDEERAGTNQANLVS